MTSLEVTLLVLLLAAFISFGVFVIFLSSDFTEIERQRDYFRSALCAAMKREQGLSPNGDSTRTIWGEIDDPKGEDLLC